MRLRNTLTAIFAAVTLLLTGAIAGFFYAYSSSVMFREQSGSEYNFSAGSLRQIDKSTLTQLRMNAVAWLESSRS
jgi:hypothetical protein